MYWHETLAIICGNSKKRIEFFFWGGAYKLKVKVNMAKQKKCSHHGNLS